jgi:4'-phosphopantetheinyl transferase EntD
VIERILPAAAVAVESRADDPVGDLFPAEEALVREASEQRRREFAGGRDCAHRALEGVGLAAGPILAGAQGEPLWPAGVVGAITHCRGYTAGAVARATDLAAIGVDAEPHAPLREGLIDRLAAAEEVAGLGALAEAAPSIHWDRLLFSAKEALYKAWFPLAGRWLGVRDSVLAIDRRQGTFTARLLVGGPVVAGAELSSLSGRWLVEDGLVLTAIAVAG